jgi:(Z)-2-((N-methylformamido)methylene)-5-hydroxybutyrolactone dehydrogenase
MSSTSVIDRPQQGELRECRMLIGGAWEDAADGRRFDSINPYDGRPWATAPVAASADVDRAVQAAKRAFEGPWGAMSASERGALIRRLADLIAEHADALAELESTDNGKLLREMGGQMRGLSGWYHYYAGAADKIEGRTIPTPKTNFFAYTLREPVGVVGAILPWNSPLLIMTYKLAPALAAGCTFVAKPAEQTPVSALEFGRLFEQAGFPPGVYNVVTGDGETGRLLASHRDVSKVAFTGSTETGSKVMKAAAEHVAAVSLELGGKSPNIVFEDADLDAATNGVVAGIFAATGQTCIAGSRLCVQQSIHDELVERLTARAKEIKLGNPLDETTEMGPVAFGDQLEKVSGYVELGLSEGARLACGGRRSDRDGLQDGFFYEPTVLTGVDNGMRIAREEIFGPVLSVIPFTDEADAIAVANDTRYGLGSGVWTNDVRRAHRVARSVRAGNVWVNCYRVVSFNVPFGGVKESGIGHENGLDAVEEYLDTKAVWMELSGESRDPFVLG